MDDVGAEKLLATVYREVQAAAEAQETHQVPRKLFPHAASAEVVCVAESLGPRTQVMSGIPWVLPDGQLSDKGALLDRDLLRGFGYTADPFDETRRYAYLTDVSHLWLGRTANGKLRRPTTADKERSAPWLEREIHAVRPRVVLLLGSHAAPFFLSRYAKTNITRLDDVVAEPIACDIAGWTTTAVPTLHPTGAQMARGGSRAAYARTAATIAEILKS